MADDVKSSEEVCFTEPIKLSEYDEQGKREHGASQHTKIIRMTAKNALIAENSKFRFCFVRIHKLKIYQFILLEKKVQKKE